MGSAISHFGHVDPGPIAPVASFLTLSLGVCASFESAYRANRRKALIAFGTLLILGGAAEVIGLATGLPFGRYEYTREWWPTVALGSIGYFPLLLPWAWLLMAGSATLVAQELSRQVWRQILLAALFATAIDVVMEPVMAGPLHYWRWLEVGPMPGGAPFTNSMGWFGVSLVAAAAFNALMPRDLRKGPAKNWVPAYVLGGHLVLTLGVGLLAR